MSEGRRVAVMALIASTLGGCFVNSKAPRRFYLASDVDFSRSAYYVAPRRAGKLRAPPKRLVVMPRWTSAVTNPVGGLYDHTASTQSPLQATFFHPDIAVPIWEACSSRLRSYGLRVFKDYGDIGNPALILPAARQERAVLLRATLTRIAHDQQKEQNKLPGYEAARTQVMFDLIDRRGRRLWRKTVDVYAKKTHTAPHDLLRGLGQALADSLIRDGSLVKAITRLESAPVAMERGGRR